MSLLELGKRVCPVLCSHRPYSVSTVEQSSELNRSLAPLEWLGKYTVWPAKPPPKRIKTPTTGLLFCWLDLCAAGRTWCRVSQGGMLGTGLPHLGRTSTRAHSLIGFRPGRRGSFRLVPVHNGSLVTPVQKSRHRGFMSACRHEAPHTLLAVPSSHRPEGPVMIAQKASRLKPERSLCLAQGAQSIE